MVSYNTKKKYKNLHNKTKKYKQKIKLQDDYYSYVNYPWIETQTIPKNRTTTNSFILLQNKVDNEMKVVLNKIIKEKTPDGIRCKNLYESNIIWNDSLVEKQIYFFIQQLNTYLKNSKNFYEFIVWFMKSGFRAPIDFGLTYDAKHPTRYICTIEPSGLAFNKKDVYFKKDKLNAEYRDSYIKYINKLFFIIFGPNNCYKGVDVLEIEIELSQYARLNEVNHIEDIYNIFTNKELLQKCNFNFKEFCFYLKFKKIPSNVMIPNPQYLIKVMKLLKKWTTTKWISYWVFQILLSAGRYHSKLFQENFTFFSILMNDVKIPISRQKFALHKIEGIMNTTLSKEYLKYYKNEKEKIFCSLLCERIKTIFKKRILINNWLSNETKKHALLKLESINFVIGYKDKWEEDPDCDFIDNDGWGNDIKYIHWVYKKTTDKYDKTIPGKKYWLKNGGISVFNVNAVFNNITNELTIPNAILQRPFVDLNKSISYNLAYLGSIIAHEFVHGFDSEGCKYDKDGIYKNWWNSQDMTSYKKKQNEIIKQYETIAKKDKQEVRGNITLTENIADIAGFSIIEDVLESYLIELNIFGENQYLYFKDLYYYYTRQWRSISKIKAINNLLNSDAHSIAKHRVNGVLMRSWRFKLIFDIQKNNGMYFESNDTIW